MEKVILFIGSNNETLRIDQSYKNKAIGILNKYLPAYTLENAVGYWGGSNEETLKISSFQDKINQDNLKQLCEELKKDLKQISIGVEIDKNSSFQEF